MRRQALFSVVSVLTVVLGCPLIAQPTMPGSGVREEATRKATVADLPLPEQYAISAALGRDRRFFHARPAEAGHGFRSMAQDLNARFGSGGLEVEIGSAKITLYLDAMGFSGAVSPVPPAGVPVVRANRIEVPRGGLVEWYVNGPLGLQQGFTLPHVPEAGDDSAIHLTLAIESDLDVCADAAGTGLVFRGANGEPVLRYCGLTAFDADGRTLAARIGFGNGRARIRVETGGARFPIVIDPIFQSAKLLASDGAFFHGFGHVAISGDTVVVGAPGDDDNGKGSGSAYVFVLVGLTGAGVPSPGGTVTLSLDAVTDAGLPYQLGSSLGSGPIRLGNRVLRLSPDDLLVITAGNLWPTIFAGYRGALDSTGRAVARINIPKIAALVGQKIYSAFVTLSPGAPFGIKSIADPYELMITQ